MSSSAVRSSSTVATQPMPFREPIRPGQAGTLVHFCGRGVAATSAPQEILELTPQQRLEGIIGDRMIRASQPFGLSYPVVSFSECDHGGVQAMLAQAGWDAWGIVVTRDWVWSNGGGPVWYVRDDAHADARSLLDGRSASWLVRTQPGHSDWLHEREWRVPCDPHAYLGVTLTAGDVAAILVADPEWEPPVEHTLGVNPGNGNLGDVLQTPDVALVPRWYWNGQAIDVLEPVGLRYEPLDG